jgi:hypothetical protein
MWEGVNCAGVDFSQVMHDYAGKYEEEYTFNWIIAWVVSAFSTTLAALLLAVVRVKNTAKFLSHRTTEFDKESGETAEEAGGAGSSQVTSPKGKLLNMVRFANPEKKTAAEIQKKIEDMGKINSDFHTLVEHITRKGKITVPQILKSLTGSSVDFIYEELKKPEEEQNEVSVQVDISICCRIYCRAKDKHDCTILQDEMLAKVTAAKQRFLAKQKAGEGEKKAADEERQIDEPEGQTDSEESDPESDEMTPT